MFVIVKWPVGLLDKWYKRALCQIFPSTLQLSTVTESIETCQNVGNFINKSLRAENNWTKHMLGSCLKFMQEYAFILTLEPWYWKMYQIISWEYLAKRNQAHGLDKKCIHESLSRKKGILQWCSWLIFQNVLNRRFHYWGNSQMGFEGVLNWCKSSFSHWNPKNHETDKNLAIKVNL